MGIARKLGATAVALAMTLSLAACGRGSDGPASAGGAAESGGATRTVVDANGEQVTVPSRPSRVVTLSEPTTDNALALGVTPIGAVAGRGQDTVANYLADRAGSVAVLGSVGKPNVEAIGAAKPDLILVDGTSIKNDPDALASLKETAPVVYTGDAGGDWRANFQVTADALNLKDQGEAKLAEYDAHVSAVSAGLAAAGYLDQTYSVVRWQGDTAGLILKELPAGRALSDLGMKRPANQDREGPGHSEPVSLENIDQIDADWIFFGTLGGSSVNNPSAGGSAGVEASRQALEEARQTPGFAGLGAEQAGHVVPVDGSVWTSTGGYLLMDTIVSDIESTFLK